MFSVRAYTKITEGRIYPGFFGGSTKQCSSEDGTFIEEQNFDGWNVEVLVRGSEILKRDEAGWATADDGDFQRRRHDNARSCLACKEQEIARRLSDSWNCLAKPKKRRKRNGGWSLGFWGWGFQVGEAVGLSRGLAGSNDNHARVAPSFKLPCDKSEVGLESQALSIYGQFCPRLVVRGWKGSVKRPVRCCGRRCHPSGTS